MTTHLTRNNRERCVMARVQRGGRRLQENFSVKKNGSWEAAEAAARDWLAPILPTLPPVPTSKNRMTKRNHSGVVGVHFTDGKRVLKSGIEADYPSYIARWPGCKGGVSFMLSTYNGEDNAFIHASICRKLETKDRAAVEEAVRTLSPADRTALLARKHPAQPTH